MTTTPRVIYSTPIVPDHGSALEVLAFVLVSPCAFHDDDTGEDEADEIHEMIYRAKVDAIARWKRCRKTKATATKKRKAKGS